MMVWYHYIQDLGDNSEIINRTAWGLEKAEKGDDND